MKGLKISEIKNAANGRPLTAVQQAKIKRLEYEKQQAQLDADQLTEEISCILEEKKKMQENELEDDEEASERQDNTATIANHQTTEESDRDYFDSLGLNVEVYTQSLDPNENREVQFENL